MKLIVGLGNPGEKYVRTRHNIGFMIVDKIAMLKEVVFRLENQFVSENADFNIDDERVKLVKPQTFMNNSGEAIEKLRNYYKLDTEDIIIIHDEVDLDLGKIKMQLGGSSAGHKGVQSVIDSIGTDQFWRVRVGVGKSDKIPTDEWVLKNFEKEIEAQVAKIIDKTAEIISQSLEQNTFNNQTYEIE